MGETYSYQTVDREFTYKTIPSKGISEMNMDTAFGNFLLKNQQYKDLILHRTFKRNWLKFWRWSDYLINDRWDYPYLEK
ncbi:MAG: hypothetical protein HKN51_09345 [Saprospiraceae bacterium]|nr:hypothetical protein [Saprospiraceae bacterium]